MMSQPKVLFPNEEWIFGLGLYLNVIIAFFLYPLWQRYSGRDIRGNIAVHGPRMPWWTIGIILILGRLLSAVMLP